MMEKWKLYWYFLNEGRMNLIMRVLIGCFLPFWFMFCFAMKVTTILAALVSGIAAGLARVWTAGFGMAVVIITILQIAGQDTVFWKTENVGFFILQIVLTIGVIILPTILTALITNLIYKIGSWIEGFNVWMLGKLA